MREVVRRERSWVGSWVHAALIISESPGEVKPREKAIEDDEKKSVHEKMRWERERDLFLWD